ncbi:hypothetical protein ACIQ9Q_41835 [Streptomyces sp. NPDC094438]|uniref:hypothetical protein n=1 Tax=Streptomyces sp. NPDC094438 TaxID=3366061 RepID=UPI00380B81BB
MTVRGDLTDEAWDRLRPFLPMSNGRCDDRRRLRIYGAAGALGALLLSVTSAATGTG